MIIITSGAYVSSEFCAEVGKLPPVMLPVGNKRLFEHQIEVLQKTFYEKQIFLSLPESYQLPKKDAAKFKKFGIQLVAVPDGMTLCDSLLYVINSIGEDDNKIKVLHGDTLIYDLPLESDVIAISKTNDDYNWEIENRDLMKEVVWSGYFSFSNSKNLIKSLTQSRGLFVDAVRSYSINNDMKLKEIFSWLDFGHINNYFKSRSKITTQRAFNLIEINRGIVIKSSTIVNEKKIVSENQWYNSVPDKIKYYTPQTLGNGYFDSGEFYYKIEYLSCIPLNEIFVHALNPSFFWVKIFKHLELFLLDCVDAGRKLINSKNRSQIEINSDLLVVDKTKKRLKKYANQTNRNLHIATNFNGDELPSLSFIVEDCISRIDQKACVLGVLHGDLCFSNILYDIRSDKIKVIDPRAIDVNGNFSYLGDLRYDFSKINHSVLGLYDHIVSGAFDLRESSDFQFQFEVLIDERTFEIQKSYMENMSLLGLSPVDIIPETILLFLSMLPLHSDDPDRQKAFIANALRLYNEFLRD